MKYEESELEERLRAMMRPVEPRAAVTAKILAEVRRRERRNTYGRWGALAAALVLAAALAFLMRPKPEAVAAHRTAEQLELALRISARKVAQLEGKLIVRVNSGIDLGIEKKTQEN